jgi:hypothetical protein
VNDSSNVSVTTGGGGGAGAGGAVTVILAEAGVVPPSPLAVSV